MFINIKILKSLMKESYKNGLLIGQTENEIHSSEDEASALARLHGLQALQNDYPDAEFVAQKVDVTTENDTLHYRVVYTIIADICT